MKVFKHLVLAALIFVLIPSQKIIAEQKGHSMSGNKAEHVPASPAMMHMNHADMISSEKDFLREMIPHHQEAVDTSVLLFVSTKDPQLKKLTEDIYKGQTSEILDIRLYYARWYNQIPTGAMYKLMMRDLNVVDGKERDILYIQDMIMHHKGAVDMAEKVLTFKGLHKETIKFAKDIIMAQKDEIKFMIKWLRQANVNK